MQTAVLDNQLFDDLGNRTAATLRGESSKTYARNEETNRYDESGTFDISCSYDTAGNTTTDQNGYQYIYDYENRIRVIKDSGNVFVAVIEYDALGRRMYRFDIANNSALTFYYYNAAWQVLSEHDGTNFGNRYVYGNYIDETLLMNDGADDYYYVHDHLFSTVALTDENGSVVERYEYNAYGSLQVSTDSDTDGTWFDSLGGWDTGDTIYAKSQYGNEYTFTGRRLETLDSGSYEIMYYRNRYYDTETARFLQQDPAEYIDGMSLYEYARSAPLIYFDYNGLTSIQQYSISTSYGLGLHGGFLIDGNVLDFGPSGSMWGSMGVVPYGLGPGAIGGSELTMSTSKFRKMQAGPKKGDKCGCLTKRNAAICLKYVGLVEWHNKKIYQLPFNTCWNFVFAAKTKCCL